jgi:hypothetical protein
MSFSFAEMNPARVPALTELLGSLGGGGWAALANASTPGSPTARSSLGERAIVTSVYSLGPAGATFAAPLTVCVTINTTDAAARGWGPAGTALNLTSALAGGAGTRLALYWSANGTDWVAAESPSLNSFTPGSATLCGALRHFTLVAGLAVPAETLAADVTVAIAALPSPTPSPTPSPPPGTIAGAAASAAASPAVVGGAVAAAVCALGGAVAAARIAARRRARKALLSSSPPGVLLV